MIIQEKIIRKANHYHWNEIKKNSNPSFLFWLKNTNYYLSSMFTWTETEEGGSYWYNIGQLQRTASSIRFKGLRICSLGLL